MQRGRLPYVSDVVELTETRYGYNMVSGIEDAYRDVKLRDKVVIRFDLLGSLRDCFEEGTLESYRGIIFKLLSGVLNDKATISKVMTILYKEDEVFRRFVGELFYFSGELEKNSLYVAVVKAMAIKVEYSRSFLRSECERIGIKVFMESDCYLYAAISDVAGILRVPGGYKEEKVSYAKNWKGIFETYE